MQYYVQLVKRIWSLYVVQNMYILWVVCWSGFIRTESSIFRQITFLAETFRFCHKWGRPQRQSKVIASGTYIYFSLIKFFILLKHFLSPLRHGDYYQKGYKTNLKEEKFHFSNLNRFFACDMRRIASVLLFLFEQISSEKFHDGDEEALRYPRDWSFS